MSGIFHWYSLLLKAGRGAIKILKPQKWRVNQLLEQYLYISSPLCCAHCIRTSLPIKWQVEQQDRLCLKSISFLQQLQTSLQSLTSIQLAKNVTQKQLYQCCHERFYSNWSRRSWWLFLKVFVVNILHTVLSLISFFDAELFLGFLIFFMPQ